MWYYNPAGHHASHVCVFLSSTLYPQISACMQWYTPLTKKYYEVYTCAAICFCFKVPGDTLQKDKVDNPQPKKDVSDDGYDGYVGM